MNGKDHKRVPRADLAKGAPGTPVTFDEVLELADLDVKLEAYAQALARLLPVRAESSALSPEDRFSLERRIALCTVRLGRIEEARDVARAALEAAPNTIPSIERARCLLVSGKAALELGQLSLARADADAVLEAVGAENLVEESGRARNILGAVALRTGQPEIARGHFEKALETFRRLGDLPRLAGTYMNLGSIQQLRCDWERASEHYHVAYYLATILGDSGRVAGAALNLGTLLLRTGSYREARSYFERTWKLGAEISDTIRVLKARLALAQMDRTELLTSRARKLLKSCCGSDASVLPGREQCFLLLEEARLDLVDGDLDLAAQRAVDLRHRVEAMAPRGDLMIDVLILEADLAAAEDRWENVTRAATAALDLARSDRDRAQEERSLLRLAPAWARGGRLGEAEATLAGLVERHRARGEWPALASSLKRLGLVRREVAGDPDGALASLREAAEVYRRLGVPRAEALVDAERVGCLIRLGRREEAVARIATLRPLTEGDEPFPALARQIERLDILLQRSEVTEPAEGPDGLQVHERLEEILSSPGILWERLNEVVLLLRDALELDGVFLARPSGADLEILASSGIDALRGKRVVSPSLVGLDGASLDELSRRREADVSRSGQSGSVLTIPMQVRGRSCLLHLQRLAGRGHGSLGRAERNYAMVLAAEIARALELATPEPEASQLSQRIALADVITQDPQVFKILELIRRVGDTDLTVLLQGETGTGKKLLAHAIHRASSRRGRPLVTVDCAALPESLLEAELFGYRKGAFTGATQDRSGLLAEAAGGTVFLDEIDKAGLTVQRRFLHLLDSSEIRPVGSASYIRLDVRIVCATSSPDLRTEVAAGRFLKDLYYRLNDISVEIPPLRERPDDVLLLAGCFVETFAAQAGRRIRGMSSSFRRALMAHDWPGNVRELEKAIRRAVTLADDDVLLTPDLLPKEALEAGQNLQEDAAENLRQRVELFERRAIEQALQSCGGNKSRAAALLGLSRKGLKGKIARYRTSRHSRTGG